MKIKSSKGEYEVRFVRDFLPEIGPALKETDVLFVDENVRQLHSERIDTLLSGHRHRLIIPTENLKSYQSAEKLIAWLIESGFRKNHRLIAIGGGITQDITAFIASILFRGVDWIFIPTNLLSQCDSCIGSKTSINFGPYKNQIGGFHPPRLVINDQTFLQSLPIDHLRSGMGEMLHYYFISGREDFNTITQFYDRAFREQETMEALIRRSLEIKRVMVERDEFDVGPRNVFNYGHSFGHAIESYTGYRVPHGIAVSFGMDIANQLSVALGLLSADEAREMRVLLKRNWTPTELGVVDLDAYIELLKKDKKNIDKEIRLILTRGLGDMFITRVELDSQFRNTLGSCFSEYAEFQKHLPLER